MTQSSVDTSPGPTVSPSVVQETFNAAMVRVYLWMALGFAISTGVAWILSSNEAMASFLVNRYWIFIVVLVVGLVVVGAINGAVEAGNPNMALGLFFVFAGFMGASLAVAFLTFSLGTVQSAFWATAATFGAMSAIGLVTRKDLSSLGPILLFGLVGLILAIVVNSFIASSAFDWIVSIAGVLIFLGFTAHDSQQIRDMTAVAVIEGDETVVRSIGVLGALSLYLDFVNLFMFILSLLGDDD